MSIFLRPMGHHNLSLINIKIFKKSRKIIIFGRQARWPHPTFLLGFLREYSIPGAEVLQKYVFDMCEHETSTQSRFKFTDFQIKLILWYWKSLTPFWRITVKNRLNFRSVSINTNHYEQNQNLCEGISIIFCGLKVTFTPLTDWKCIFGQIEYD